MTPLLQPLSHHLEELRSFLFKFFLIVGLGFFFMIWWAPDIVHWLLQQGREEDPLLLLSPLEGFSLVCRFAFWGSFVGTSPLWLIACLRFVQPALHSHEKKWLFSLLIGSYVALSIGVCGSLRWFLPWSSTFFASFNQRIGQNAWSAANYAEFALSILFGVSCLAEICFLFFWSLTKGLLSAEQLLYYRRWWVLGSFILGALLTPPDVVSQLCMAVPLIFVFEATYWILHFQSLFFLQKETPKKPKWKHNYPERE